MYQFESRVRYSEVDSERQLTLPAVMDYLQDLLHLPVGRYEYRRGISGRAEAGVGIVFLGD